MILVPIFMAEDIGGGVHVRVMQHSDLCSRPGQDCA